MLIGLQSLIHNLCNGVSLGLFQLYESKFLAAATWMVWRLLV